MRGIHKKGKDIRKPVIEEIEVSRGNNTRLTTASNDHMREPLNYDISQPNTA